VVENRRESGREQEGKGECTSQATRLWNSEFSISSGRSRSNVDVG